MSVKLQFTRTSGTDGKSRPTGHPFFPPVDEETKLEANDVHFKFDLGDDPHMGGTIKFTKDGAPHGEDSVREIHPKAKDVGIEFHKDKDGKVTIRDIHWVDEEGNVIRGIDGYFPAPDGTNDFHLSVPRGKITGMYWTLDGHLLRVSKVPKDVNDVHLTPESRQETNEHAYVPQSKQALAALFENVLRKLPIVRIEAPYKDVGQSDKDDESLDPGIK